MKCPYCGTELDAESIYKELFKGCIVEDDIFYETYEYKCKECKKSMMITSCLEWVHTIEDVEPIEGND